MKKIITALLCLSIFALLLTSCTPSGQEEPSDKPCNHSYSEGKCIHCNADDPSYNPNEKPGDNGNGDTEDDNDSIPPIDLDNTTELPFVPAS